MQRWFNRSAGCAGAMMGRWRVLNISSPVQKQQAALKARYSNFRKDGLPSPPHEQLGKRDMNPFLESRNQKTLAIAYVFQAFATARQVRCCLLSSLTRANLTNPKQQPQQQQQQQQHQQQQQQRRAKTASDACGKNACPKIAYNKEKL